MPPFFFQRAGQASSGGMTSMQHEHACSAAASAPSGPPQHNSVETRYSAKHDPKIYRIPTHISRRRCGFAPIKFIATKSFYRVFDCCIAFHPVMGRSGMDLMTKTRSLFAVGECTTPHGRALVCEQFRILTNQVPILYAVLLLDSVSIGLVLPSSVNGWLRFALPGALMAVSVIRMIQWIRMRGVELTPEEAYRFLARMRIFRRVARRVSDLDLALIEVVDPALRAPISLLVFMGCIGSAYCLGIFPPASRLTLLIAGLPLAMRLLASGEPLLVCIGINLGLLLVLFVRMINTNFGNFVRLIETQAKLAEEGERARAAHSYLTAALDVVPEGLAIFDKEDRLVLWNRQYPSLYASNAAAIVQGARFDDILRAGLRHRQYADAVGRRRNGSVNAWPATPCRKAPTSNNCRATDGPGSRNGGPRTAAASASVSILPT